MKRTVTNDLLIVLLGAASILMVPLLAMQFNAGMNWDLFDFAIAGVLLAGTGLIHVVLSRTAGRHRILIGAALAIALLVVYVDLGVGLFGMPWSGS